MACEEDYFLRFDLNSACLKFVERALCMPTCMEHNPSMQKSIDTGFLFLCKEGKVDNLIDWRECQMYYSFKETDRFRSDVELTEFYAQVIQMRAKDL